MNKHVLSAKHLFFTKKYHKSSKEAIKVVKVVKNHKCPFCSKMFKSRGGKYKHIKKCFDNPEILKKKLEEQEKHFLYELEEKHKKLDKLAKQKDNLEVTYLREKIAILEKHKVVQTQNINTQNNNYINIQLYLDKHCQNAMPIMDFIKELQFKLTDINPKRPASTIESLSRAITAKLEDMEETERPMHCSDVKRLVFHVKDASGWTTDVDNKKIDKAIGWANMRHQGAWYERVKEEGLDQTKKDVEYHTMNVAMAKFSDDPKKAKRKIKRAIANTTKIKNSCLHKPIK